MKVGKSNKGVMTVEACISFTFFSMVILTILFLIRIVYTYGVIQHAITETAKEMSNYSYIYSCSGLKDINDAYVDVTQKGKSYFDGKAETVVDAYESLLGVASSGLETYKSVVGKDLEETINSANDTYKSYDELKGNFPKAVESIKDAVSNPVKLMKSIGCIFAGGVGEDIKTFVGGEITRNMMASYIADMDENSGSAYDKADKRLKALQVQGGLDGLDFSCSKFYSDGETIDIVVCYRLKPIMPINVMPEINLINRISVRGWF